MKKYEFKITPEDMRRHTEQGYALLGALTKDNGFDPVSIVIFSTLIFNTHTWLMYQYVLKGKDLIGVELRDD